MGDRITFTINGQKGQGWLAKPASGAAPAVVVIQEWWGLVAHVMDVTERFAHEGFLAFAPDLYHGKTTTSPDEAGASSWSWTSSAPDGRSSAPARTSSSGRTAPRRSSASWASAWAAPSPSTRRRRTRTSARP